MKHSTWLAFVLLLAAGTLPATAADWPQFRYDAGRSAASPEQLPGTLHLQWMRRLPPPEPAFPGEIRLQYDATYQPVVSGHTMFVPLMTTESLLALDTRTGQEQWHFVADGPIRFAPVAAEGRVYFVADDGCLYCVDAATGKLQWKVSGLPPQRKDRRLLGHRHLISLWPARGGPLLHDGVVYFAAGIWSKYGVGIYAVDAASGKVLWSNTESNHIARANMDHGVAHYAGLSPQGYLALVNGKLVVPCGPQLPAFLDPKNGHLETYTMGWGGRNRLPKGTWFVAGVGNYLSTSGDLYDTSRKNDEQFPTSQGRGNFKPMLYPGGYTRIHVDPTNAKDLGAFSRPVLTADILYDAAAGRLTAYDLHQVKLQERSAEEMADSKPGDPWPDKWKAVFHQLWQMETKLRLHIKAGNHLYLGGSGKVQALQLTAEGQKPKTVWETTVDGIPEAMLAADGKLFVVTNKGTIYAFGPQAKQTPVVHQWPGATAALRQAEDDRWSRLVEETLKAASASDGYAVVLGVSSGKLVEQLLTRSELYVIAVDSDAGRVAALREQLHRAGLYGLRASVQVGNPLQYPLPPLLASVVMSEDWARVGAGNGGLLVDRVFRLLRPYGGAARLAGSCERVKPLVEQGTDSTLVQAKIVPCGSECLLVRAGPLPGAATWSHGEADPGNSNASADRFLRPPLELLWFDGPPRWQKALGATLVRVVGGRMYIKAARLRAVDVFTGRTIWDRALPFPHNGRSEFVAADDALYVAAGRSCLVIDPTTGKTARQIELTAEIGGSWSLLRVSDGQLVGRAGKRVFCLDRAGGKLLWQQPCRLSVLSVAAGGGKVFCAEMADPRRGESNKDSRIRALDLQSGKLLWEVTPGAPLRYGASHDVLVTPSGILSASDGRLVAAFPKVQPPPNVRPEHVPKPWAVLDRWVLFGTAESFATIDLSDGKPVGDPMRWMRRGCTIPRASFLMVTTRVRGNAATVDLASRKITSFWNVRAACSNNLFPADGVLSMPSLTGGCTCNYVPVSQAFVPAWLTGQPNVE